MRLRAIRVFSLCISLIACSTDVVVVGALDSSGGASGTGGAASGGSHTLVERGGAGSGGILQGAVTTSVCACRGENTSVCSADGVTYDPTCPAGCTQVSIACFHACPCDESDGGASSVEESGWVDAKCFDSQMCVTGSLCVTADASTPPPSCAP